ncbi:N(G),N(G)-dimethylarginine dimethylaminohydrolase, partial [Candidatus Saccharibacteria bacterium]|nr:N(G),N(G)-dimethylarginine dimethylaminohydrolase [Candidatus Saccharibacteria bacterium]
MFRYAITRRPSRSLINGISQTPEKGKPDYERAMQQYDQYVALLRQCGLEVTVLEPNEE